MIKYITLLLFSSFLFLLACNKSISNNKFPDAFPNESFEELDPSAFNESIKEARYITNAGAFMELYYPNKVAPNAEGNESIDITPTDLKNGYHKVLMIHDRMLDDSQRGIKLIMIAKEDKGLWQVVMVKKNWRCWKGRGHEDWGTENCN